MTVKYISYLVRFWQDNNQAQPDAWQVEIESIQTGERWHFADLTKAVEFLKQQPESHKAPSSLKRDNNQD
jgi:hypothetical protein